MQTNGHTPTPEKPNYELSVVDQRPVSAETLGSQVRAIQEAMKLVMHEGTHFGKVPGCGDKPTLLKPGAEKISMMFRLVPSFIIDERPLENGHREYRITCRISNVSGQLLGEGVGAGSTKESKYRWRTAERVCPECGKNAIRKSKFPPRGNPSAPPGWYCHDKAGGCGTVFDADDERITEQKLGRVENPDIADTYNTVLKMCKKRAHVDAILTVTAASDIFTQDIEDFAAADAAPAEPEQKAPTRPASRTATQKAQPLAKSAQVGPSAELKPLPNPWIHKLEGSVVGYRGKPLADVGTEKIQKALRDKRLRAALTHADIANMEACLEADARVEKVAPIQGDDQGPDYSDVEPDHSNYDEE